MFEHLPSTFLTKGLDAHNIRCAELCLRRQKFHCMLPIGRLTPLKSLYDPFLQFTNLDSTGCPVIGIKCHVNDMIAKKVSKARKQPKKSLATLP